MAFIPLIPIAGLIIEEEGPAVEEEAVVAGEAVASGVEAVASGAEAVESEAAREAGALLSKAEALAQEVEAEGKTIFDEVEQALTPDEVGQVETQCPLQQAAGEANQAATDAENIANGHAWEKHAGEFGDITQDEFQDLVQDTIENPSASKSLSNGRAAYWNDEQQMVVITNPNDPDGGTAFIPDLGKAYFDGLK